MIYVTRTDVHLARTADLVVTATLSVCKGVRWRVAWILATLSERFFPNIRNPPLAILHCCEVAASWSGQAKRSKRIDCGKWITHDHAPVFTARNNREIIQKPQKRVQRSWNAGLAQNVVPMRPKNWAFYHSTLGHHAGGEEILGATEPGTGNMYAPWVFVDKQMLLTLIFDNTAIWILYTAGSGQICTNWTEKNLPWTFPEIDGKQTNKAVCHAGFSTISLEKAWENNRMTIEFLNWRHSRIYIYIWTILDQYHTAAKNMAARCVHYVVGVSRPCSTIQFMSPMAQVSQVQPLSLKHRMKA